MESKAAWIDRISTLLEQPYQVIEIYDNGREGNNEVTHVRLADGTDVVIKIMLVNKKYHQRRKALTEATMESIDRQLGGKRVVPNVDVGLFELTQPYVAHWGAENPEGHKRVCYVIRGHGAGGPGDEWRGQMYRQLGNLDMADEHCKSVMETHPDAERISFLDFATINQDRSARNWVTRAGQDFTAIDNGMAWFHEYPDSDTWKYGCAIDDVILQVGEWRFISGVFSTLWAGRPLSDLLRQALAQFDESAFLEDIAYAAVKLGFPAEISQDWRFEGILRRMRWIRKLGMQPPAELYRSWHRDGSEFMTPPEITASGGKIVWQLAWDHDSP